MLFLWTRGIQFGTSAVEGSLDRKDITAFETLRELNVIYLPVISKIIRRQESALKVFYFESLHAIKLLIWKKM